MHRTTTTARSLVVGVDPGEVTGLAVYDPAAGQLVAVTSLPFWTAALRLVRRRRSVAVVVVEDARALPVYARHGAVRGPARDRLARGVGHTDRDTGLWLELCAALGLPAVPVTPQRRAKWSAEDLARFTGWTAPTNEHSRDAARLVYGMSVSQALALAGKRQDVAASPSR